MFASFPFLFLNSTFSNMVRSFIAGLLKNYWVQKTMQVSRPNHVKKSEEFDIFHFSACNSWTFIRGFARGLQGTLINSKSNPTAPTKVCHFMVVANFCRGRQRLLSKKCLSLAMLPQIRDTAVCHQYTVYLLHLRHPHQWSMSSHSAARLTRPEQCPTVATALGRYHRRRPPWCY